MYTVVLSGFGLIKSYFCLNRVHCTFFYSSFTSPWIKIGRVFSRVTEKNWDAIPMNYKVGLVALIIVLVNLHFAIDPQLLEGSFTGSFPTVDEKYQYLQSHCLIPFLTSLSSEHGLHCKFFTFLFEFVPFQLQLCKHFACSVTLYFKR